ncbi:MAG: tetratricopeptide repeat protein [Treponema sp.]|nr:tetratricopeptide repeat protein [Treponema sp.]
MSLQLFMIIFVTAGIAFLVYYMIRHSRAHGRITKDYRNRAKILQAIKTAKAAVERDPKDAVAHFYLGRAFLADKRDEQALREYKSASRLGVTGTEIPETEFRETIADLYARFHEPNEALKEYILLIKRHPENPEYYFLAGKLFSTRNRPDLCEQYLRKAVSLNPKEERFRFELGMRYFLSKKMKEAANEFENVLKINPTHGEAFFYMGKISKNLKDYTGAIEYLEKAANDWDNKLRALVEIGTSYMSLKMFDKAIAELERAVNVITEENDNESLHARYFLAMCYEREKEFPKAVAQWEIIYERKKNFKDVGEKLTQYIEYKNA